MACIVYTIYHAVASFSTSCNEASRCKCLGLKWNLHSRIPYLILYVLYSLTFPILLLPLASTKQIYICIYISHAGLSLTHARNRREREKETGKYATRSSHCSIVQKSKSNRISTLSSRKFRIRHFGVTATNFFSLYI